MRVFDYIDQNRIVFEAGSAEAVIAEIARRNVKRVFVVSARSLTASTQLQDIIAALRTAFVGHSDLIEAHVPLPLVLKLSQVIGQANPDLVLVVGGGSAIDSVKIATLALAHDLTSVSELLSHTGTRIGSSDKSPPYRTIAVPTTLSGAEFGIIGGGVDPDSGIKHLFRAPYFCAATVIYDPYLATHTPAWLWLSTGMRAVDHAVEAFLSPDANPFSDGTALHGLRQLARGLPNSKQNPEDWRARSEGQMGVWLAAASLGRVRYGASHGIGHQLGAVAAVPHGYTSCVLLPAVLTYNSEVVGNRYDDITGALGISGESAPSAVAKLVAGLELPRNLRDLNVDRSLLPKIAQTSLTNLFVQANPRPVRTVEDAMQILDLAWNGLY
jgi:alcohol dehydrogenase class IV